MCGNTKTGRILLPVAKWGKDNKSLKPDHYDPVEGEIWILNSNFYSVGLSYKLLQLEYGREEPVIAETTEANLQSKQNQCVTR